MHRIARVALFVAAASVICSTAGCRPAAVGPPSTSGGGGDLAAVLVTDGSGSRVVVVDLERMRVTRRIGLRSAALDMAVDESSGLLVTAQSGGLGTDADDAAGLVDPRSGDVTYVDLERPNPMGVACTGGSAYLLHGWEASGTLFVSVVDPRARAVARAGEVPRGPGMWAAAAGSLWTFRADGAGPGELLRVDPLTLRSTPVDCAALTVFDVFASGDRLYALTGNGKGGRVDVLGMRGDGPGGTPVPGLPFGPRQAVAVGGTTAVIDWCGEEPETRAFGLVDTVTGTSSVVPVDGVPCAVAGWGRRVLLVDRVAGRLTLHDAAGGRSLGSVDLGVEDLVVADIEVVTGGVRQPRTVAAAAGGQGVSVR